MTKRKRDEGAAGCPDCGGRAKVTDSRPTAANTHGGNVLQPQIYTRRHHLCECGRRFTTIEIPVERFRDMKDTIESHEHLERLLRSALGVE